MHKDIEIVSEDQHVIECSRNTKRHTIRERNLTKGVDQEDCACGSDGSGVSNTDPRAHTQTIGTPPLTTHVAEDANEEGKTTS